ncbi:MAG: hypothetical protein COA73_06705 [Candidatus Hydrogenedentota bacterium]|nr:MAG: hypothetical protein COA73_06705 [Candidatus Hydrogenedentota bacterium]
MTKPKAERRNHPRSQRGFSLSRSDDGLLDHVDNISCSGVLCHTQRPLPEMTKMEIVLGLPDADGHEICAEGVVVRCTAEEPDHTLFKVAILYTKLDDNDYRAIDAFVEQDLNQ